MAKRHNIYSRLLGTVENDVQPLNEQSGALTAGVPDLHDMASQCESMSTRLDTHAKKLHALGDLQPKFNDAFSQQFAGANDPEEIY